MAEHAGRLAAVLSVYADPDAIEVSGKVMACGVALAQHFACTKVRSTAGALRSLRRAPESHVAGTTKHGIDFNDGRRLPNYDLKEVEASQPQPRTPPRNNRR
jgi:hypothetical protein